MKAIEYSMKDVSKIRCVGTLSSLSRRQNIILLVFDTLEHAARV